MLHLYYSTASSTVRYKRRTRYITPVTLGTILQVTRPNQQCHGTIPQVFHVMLRLKHVSKESTVN